jgi:peptide/nickel transport system substrate-binding protein
MKRDLRGLAAAGALLMALAADGAAFAQKQGGILRMYSPDSPASMSIHEEATVFAEGPMMGVFNNLVMYDQHLPQNSLQSIVPDLAIGWSWNEDGTELTLPLHDGVTWHDGKPFTARDVQCTWDMLTGKTSEKLRVNPRKSWYSNLDGVTTNGDYEVTFHLKRLLASLSLPRAATRYAQPSDRHRPVQIRRVQAE